MSSFPYFQNESFPAVSWIGRLIGFLMSRLNRAQPQPAGVSASKTQVQSASQQRLEKMFKPDPAPAKSETQETPAPAVQVSEETYVFEKAQIGRPMRLNAWATQLLKGAIGVRRKPLGDADGPPMHIYKWTVNGVTYWEDIDGASTLVLYREHPGVQKLEFLPESQEKR